MKRKLLWLVLSCLMVAALVLSSCQPAPAAETTKEQTVTGKVVEKEAPAAKEVEEKEEVIQEKKLATIATVPKYGGTLISVISSDVRGFDTKLMADYSTTAVWTHEKLAKGDWARGPAGTGEVTWVLPGIWAFDFDAPMVAESWEWPDSETIILHIRKGVYFHDKAPAFGRELTAEDVAYSIYRKSLDPNSMNYPTKEENRLLSVEATDKWTVVVKTPEAIHGSSIQSILAETWMYPQELGDGDATDWKDVCGTGPFVLTDYVVESSLTFTRNPNYWLEDPVNPGNTLPYLDSYRQLVITDASTRLSALRTGKIDQYRGVEWDDAEGMMRSNPELNYSRYLQHTAPMIWMRLDNEELPYADLKVRRALSMAIDRDALIESYYNGNAEKFCQPVLPCGELGDIFIPLEEQSELTQEAYGFHPDTAKTLMAEAGYPNGFKASIVCLQASVDVLSIIKQMWLEIGVDLELDPRESGAYQSVQRGGGYDNMLLASETGIYYTVPLAHLEDYIPIYNRSYGYDQYVEDYYEENILPNRGPVNDKTLRANLRELVPYLADLLWAIEIPTQYYYSMWQPWVGGFRGEFSTGRGWWGDSPMYEWVDQDVKYNYTGQR
ncbi:MAG TPA: ABC transporter substrate-binding protein [Dehalococcoidales bacterium]|nr:ABC transporter substrate-binding protein [Dehalococcoidales bacterium]